MTASIDSFARLVCGGDALDRAPDSCEVAQVLMHLRSGIVGLLGDLTWVNSGGPERVSRYGPYFARSLLELGATALIGRMDPTRILFTKRTQEHSGYVTGIPWKTAVRWQGDVMSDAVANLWNPSHHPKDMTRAIFGAYYADLYWHPAMKRLADEGAGTGAWVAGLRSVTPEQFVASRREGVGRLYSESSKGVHHEFVVPVGSRYDRATISQLVLGAIQAIAEVSLLVHLVPHAPYGASATDAFELFAASETIEVFT